MPSTTPQQDDLLKHYGLVSEEQLAAILGITPKTLQNRRPEKLPKFIKQGRRRLFLEDSVRDYLRPKS